MTSSATLRKFFFPSFNKRFLLRLLVLICASWLVFSFLLIPLRIEGHSMEPTYRDSSFALCWRLQYLFSPPKRGDVVTVRFAGKNIMLLKRIIGLPGETVSFVNGKLFIDTKAIPEPYVTHNSNWQNPVPLQKVMPVSQQSPALAEHPNSALILVLSILNHLIFKNHSSVKKSASTC